MVHENLLATTPSQVFYGPFLYLTQQLQHIYTYFYPFADLVLPCWPNSNWHGILHLNQTPKFPYILKIKLFHSQGKLNRHPKYTKTRELDHEDLKKFFIANISINLTTLGLRQIKRSWMVGQVQLFSVVYLQLKSPLIIGRLRVLMKCNKL